jgi:mannonate dehydratase
MTDSPLTHGREYREEEMWENYERFLEEVLPVAEEAGVKLALHPCDPPVEKLGGVPFIFRDFESFKRADRLAESKYHGLELCLGTWSEMGENIVEVIQYFGERNKIFYVHFRDVEGTVPSFHEIFLNEGGGNYDKYEVLKTLREVGFQGVMIVDHVPRVEGDSKWGHRARANAIGYLQGLVRGLEEN